MLVTLEELRAAQQRVSGVAVHTPLVVFGDGLWVKAEGLQPIGSFKLRGAYNKVASLTPAQRACGVITYSSGNHAQGVAYAARAVGAKAIIVMPNNAPLIKVKATQALGAEIVTVGPTTGERQARAEELAAQHGYVIIPPYNDRDIIAGQGSCGLEIMADRPTVDLVIAPVFANDAAQSFKAGHIVAFTGDQSQTAADGLRSQSVGSLNFKHIQAYVDDIITVTEEEIREAMRRTVAATRLVPEPSGVVTVAAALFHREQLPPARETVAIMSGGNVDPSFLRSVLEPASR
jgi:threonine dehydratase